MVGSAGHEELQRGTSAVVIARNIRTLIEGGTLTHGQQLPSTRALAKEWDTSVATITRAMGMLAEEGLVLNRARSSRVVNNPESDLRAKPGQQTLTKVLLIGGYAGSGKTELGRILARRTGWAILDKDTTTRHVVEAALEALGELPQGRDESEAYQRFIRPAEYDALTATMVENLKCGVSAVVTAPFIRELNDATWCRRTKALVEGHGAELHVVWVRCDEATMRTYLKHRGAARDSWKLTNWERYIAGVDVKFRPAIEFHEVENSADARPLQQQATELLGAINSATPVNGE